VSAAIKQNSRRNIYHDSGQIHTEDRQPNEWMEKNVNVFHEANRDPYMCPG
jgi:hypothetical protein